MMRISKGLEPMRASFPSLDKDGPVTRFGLGVFRIADPRITLASLSSIFLGAAAAAVQGPLAWGWLLATCAGIVAIEAAKNASGEIVDFDSGADLAVLPEDRSPFSGGKRVLVDRLLSRRQTAFLAAGFYAVGIGVGFAITVFREPLVLAVGLAGVGLAYFYHGSPLRLSYRGLGEAAVAVTYGPLIACGTYVTQRHGVSPDVFLASLPLGLMIAAFLWINQFPDARADELAGKRTLVVRLGRPVASRVFAAIVILAYGGLAGLSLQWLPVTASIGFIGLPHALRAASRLRVAPESTREIIPAQRWTLLSFVLLALGTGLGLLLAEKGTLPSS